MDRHEAYQVDSALYLHFRQRGLQIAKVADNSDKLAGIIERRGHGTRRDDTNHDLVLLSQMSDNASASGSDVDIICSLRPVPEETSLADPYDLVGP